MRAGVRTRADRREDVAGYLGVDGVRLVTDGWTKDDLADVLADGVGPRGPQPAAEPTVPPRRSQAASVRPVRTLHFGLRVTDLERSLAFYTGVGYEVVGSVPETAFGSLTMLMLPGDEFVTIELVHDPAKAPVDRGTILNHFVIKVESMADTVADLAAKGIPAEPPTSPDGSADFLTSWLTDPDGNRIELVQWPPGHADGITKADTQG